jgi:hypothetical protein
VTGTVHRSNITYSNDTNGTTNVNSRSGWTQTISLRDGKTAYLTAQNDGDDGTVIAEILFKGKVVRRSESEGAYCIASVSAR